ncbi:protein NRT1/ PTR FAMILY 5.5-like [Salvia miltiorrhiza]|uniref:protein NRT1/ PTR FAMILY 5.5-like n=1 Tax=Salvia miltiorrhiza TaxID=226208 RepID=UPI0025AD60D9|nr:protein NRT1/ PTR FAMILY 5.5-like [Salvia miltiorrhiza]
MGILRVAGLVWAETVMEGVFFIMQTYFTDVWKLSFTNAATILNIWGGLYRILPFFFLFLADTLLGNLVTLALSGISSTAGIVLITVATAPVFGHIVSGGRRCQDTEETECVAHTEKLLFMIGLALIALGRAARFASTEPFIEDQTNIKHQDDQTANNKEDETNNKDQTTNYSPDEDETNNNKEKWKPPIWWVLICLLVFFFTPITVIIAFPYVKKWYVLFGVSACITTCATLFYLLGAWTYDKPKQKPEGSNPITDFVRVFVAAAFKRSQPFPKDDDMQLHRIDGQEFQSLSSTRILGFLHKAAIVVPGDRRGDGKVDERSWRVCSVSQVESVKILIRMVPILSSFIMCGVVASIGNTYFIEQASHMNSRIGSWEPPLQLLLLVFTLVKYSTMCSMAPMKIMLGKYGAIPSGMLATMYSVVCCAVAAAVERRRVHVLRRHNLLDLPDDGDVPMSAAWLYFQIGFVAAVESYTEYGLWAFVESGAPESMKRYQDCIVEGVSGLGFLCGALSVYVVGKVSEAGDSNNWFQYTLNKSRLDRYYWVLTTLCSLNLIAFLIVLCIYNQKKEKSNQDEDGEDFLEKNAGQHASEVCCIKKGSALELIARHYSSD